jgi:hypothetical protein
MVHGSIKKVMKYGTQREEEEFVLGEGGLCRPHPTMPFVDWAPTHGPCHTKASHELYHNLNICKT